MDSWFVPAFSAIADSTALLNHVIPPDQGFSKHENYCGIFHFRFWFGRWIEIVIDDLLPTRKGLTSLTVSPAWLASLPLFQAVWST